MSQDRGAIHSIKRYSQLRDYSGLRYKNITPTDIDGLIEFHNKGYVILELKYSDNELDFGQKLALERLTDDLSKTKEVICIIATHKEPPDKIINTALTVVVKYRYKKVWRKPPVGTITTDLVTRFLDSLL